MTNAPLTHAPSSARFDLLGLGNAIVDVLAPASAETLAAHSMIPGAMNLIDAERADILYAALRDLAGRPGSAHALTQSSGGSVANTCVAAAALGARVAYLGTVAEDGLGDVFADDIARAGVHFPSARLSGTDAPGTARCMILVAPDGSRTMNTYLGACTAFTEAQVDEQLVRESAITYLEGYLFDDPAAKAAFRKAARIARAAGRRVALSISDPFCAERHRDDFRALLAEVDILFANEHEAESLFQTGFEAAAEALSSLPIAVLTRGAAGSVILSGGERIEIPALPTEVVDTTGAGDAYAAGFLAGLAAGRPLRACGLAAAACAAEVISHYGARPERDLRALVDAALS